MNLDPHPLRPVTRRPGAAWTLIELLGVLAIIAILALVLVPILIRQFDRLAREQEQKNLKDMAAAFEATVRRTRQIGTVDTFPALVAGELGWRQNAVLTNERGLRRVFLADPRLRVGPTTNSVLPYTQDWQGTVQPVNPRILLVSPLSLPMPGTLASGVLASTNDFDLLWNSPEGTVPNSWGWDGQPEDFLVERIELGPTFVPVVLNHQSPNYGQFGTDAGATNAMNSAVYSTWYVRGTVLRLHGEAGELQTTEIIQDPVSFVYENGRWRGRLFLGAGTRELTGLDLQMAAERFLASPWNPNAKQSADQAKVVNALSNYMVAYIGWAQGGFSYANNNAAYSAVGTMQTALQNVSVDLLFKP